MFVKGHSLQAQVSTLSVSLEDVLSWPRCHNLGLFCVLGATSTTAGAGCAAPAAADGGAAFTGRADNPEAKRRGRRGAEKVGALAPGPGRGPGGEPLSFDRQAGARRATGRAKAQWGEAALRP